MCDVALVQVRERLQQLLQDSFRLVLGEPSLRLCLQVRMQTLTLRILHHQIDELRSVNRLMQLNNVRMGEPAQNANLSDGLLLALGLLQLGSIVLLNGHLLTTGLVYALLDDSVGSVTDLLPEVVHVQITAVWRCKLVRVHEGPGLRIMESCRCPVEGAIERVAIGTGLVGCCHHEVIAVVHPAVEEGVAH